MSLIQVIKIAELVKSGEASLQTGPFGTQLKASDYVEHGVPVINVRNIGFGDIRQDNLEFLNEIMTEKMSAHKLKRGDIVFGRKGAVERHAFIKDIGVGWIQGSDCLRLRINSDRIDNQFVSYFFKTHAHQDWMQAVCSFGATMASLNQDIVKLITIPLPPLDVQRKIAGILSAYDDLIENNQRRIALLENMAEELYREWFVRFRFPGWREAEFEKGIPKGWEIKKFKELCDFVKGKNPEIVSDTCADDFVKYITMESLSDKGQVYTKKQKNSVFCEYGDILMLMDGSRSGLVFRSNQSGVLGSTLSAIKLNDFLQNYIYEYLKLTSGEIISNNTGSAIPHANKEYINRMLLIVPNNKLLLEGFNKIYDDKMKMILKLKSQVAVLEKTKNALLPRLISGKLAVEDLAVQLPPSMHPKIA